MSGWIKLHRSLSEWEWYDDHNAVRLLIHLLISVNYEDKKWQGLTIKAGSRMTSFEKLAEETGMTIKQIRNSITKLENSGEVARERARKGQLISLVKWDKLQSDEEKRASKRADKGQEKGKKRATTKEREEIKKEKKEVLHTSINDEIEMFLTWFNGQCQIVKGKRGNFKVLSSTDRNNFRTLKAKYSQQDFISAIQAMAKNKWVIENNAFNPQHFLRVENFNRYLGQSESSVQSGTVSNPIYTGRG